MVWDYAEANIFSGSSGDFMLAVDDTLKNVRALSLIDNQFSHVDRASADELPYDDQLIDVIVTDPPYYDYISYADLADFFYIWLKRTVGTLYSAHFNSDLTPKKNDAAAPFYRKDTRASARQLYETRMSNVFKEAFRVLKSDGCMVVVYAHKTTAGWSTLINSLRVAGFGVTEAWPLDTELTGHRKKDIASLASSFFLVARKRDEVQFNQAISVNYTIDILPEMQRIVKERIGLFSSIGITGADLNIAAVGAGLAPYTSYARVELPNGDELTAADYLTEVQAEVVRVLLGEAANADKATQYYIIARENYGEAWVDFDEANNLARATGIELDSGPNALTRGHAAQVEKKGAKVRLRNFAERGPDKALGLPTIEHPKAPLIDVLHRLLWLAENDNSEMTQFLLTAAPDRHWLRVVAESLKGTVLAGEPTPGAMRDSRSDEQRAIGVLLASWRRIVDEGKMV